MKPARLETIQRYNAALRAIKTHGFTHREAQSAYRRLRDQLGPGLTRYQIRKHADLVKKVSAEIPRPSSAERERAEQRRRIDAELRAIHERRRAIASRAQATRREREQARREQEHARIWQSQPRDTIRVEDPIRRTPGKKKGKR